MAQKGTSRGTRYFLKTLGLPDEAMPEIWWRERPEIVTGVFFPNEPKAIQPGARLIYYAIGGHGRCFAEVEVTGKASQDFESPPHWTPQRRKRFSWRMPVTVLAKCAANSRAPRFRDYHPRQVAQGPFQKLTDEEGERLAEAIRIAGEGG